MKQRHTRYRFFITDTELVHVVRMLYNGDGERSSRMS